MSFTTFVGAWRATLAPPTRRCGRCTHFMGSASDVESAFAGMGAMGSAYASVRAGDGLCNLHSLYLSDRAICDSFHAASTANRQE